jgi:hypothetical protein
MKKLKCIKWMVILIGLTFPVILCGQVQTKTLFSGKIYSTNKYPYQWAYEQSIRDSDTSIYFYLSYQNDEYNYITDLGSIYISNKKSMKEFFNTIDRLNNLGSDESLEIKVGLNTYYRKGNSYFHITDNNGKYTLVSEKKILKLIEDIKPYIDLLPE